MPGTRPVWPARVCVRLTWSVISVRVRHQFVTWQKIKISSEVRARDIVCVILFITLGLDLRQRLQALWRAPPEASRVLVQCDGQQLRLELQVFGRTSWPHSGRVSVRPPPGWSSPRCPPPRCPSPLGWDLILASVGRRFKVTGHSSGTSPPYRSEKELNFIKPALECVDTADVLSDSAKVCICCSNCALMIR